MRVLLDTNIIIHREASRVINQDIGILFQWLDRLHYKKCVHPTTIAEIKKYADPKVVTAMMVKLDSYYILKTEAPLHKDVNIVSNRIDTTENDREDTKLLNEVYCDRVDYLISEDKKIHTKASMLGISEKVFRIDSFLEKQTAEHPDFVNYRVLAVKKQHFGEIDLADAFFDTFREDYKGFDKWFNKKADEEAYICYNNGVLSAFLYIKVEDENENYSDIQPTLSKTRRLKIGTFKVTSNGIKLGERFLKIIFDNARQYRVKEIYVTIFDKRPEQQRLISLLEDWGFTYYGLKSSSYGEEKVYVRNFEPAFNSVNPKLTFPYLSNKGEPKKNRVFIVPIYPAYHTELFPDSILNTESKQDFVDNEPHRNAISKSYISHSWERGLAPGDLILFYRTGTTSPKIYSGVATTIGIVESVVDKIADFATLTKIVRKRTVLTNEELRAFWERNPKSKPFVVNFLYAYSFKKRPNLKQLNEMGVIPDIGDMPRGFRQVEWRLFAELVKQYGI